MAEEKTTFSGRWYKDLQPLEWLQYMAEEFSGLAEAWDDFDPNHFEERFEDYKEENPNIGKMGGMYEEIAHSVSEFLLHDYICESGDIIREIEPLKPFVLEEFEGCVIFPNLLDAIGVIEAVIRVAEEVEHYYWYCLYYCCGVTKEEAIKYFGKNAEKRFDSERELTEDDYEKAFDCITELLEIIEKRQFSQKLRESAWAIKGYCKLKVGSEKYAEIETEIAKRYEKAYQSYQYAEKKIGGDVTDRRAYNYLKEHGVEGVEDFELPIFETWQRYVRFGRKRYGTQKKTPRAGRISGRSTIKPNQIQSLSEISSQYTEEDK